MTTALEKWGRAIAKAALPLENIPAGPWRGAMESRPADLVPRDYAVGEGSSNFLYLPRTGTFKRRGGQTILFDSDGVLPGTTPPPEFFSWSDNRDTNAQVYVQKMVDGVAQWADDGLLVSAATAGTTTSAPSAIVETADGGVVILYRENLGGTISVMAQRYNSDGVKQWGSTGGPGRRAAPDFDWIDGTWLNQAGSPSNLFDSINEITPDAADYIRTPAVGQSKYLCEVAGFYVTPVTGSRIKIVFHALREAPSTTGSMTVRLLSGSNSATATIKASTTVSLTTSSQEFTYELTAAEIASVSNWNDPNFGDDLYLEFDASGDAGNIRVEYASIHYHPPGVMISNATSTYLSVSFHSFNAMSDGGTGFIFSWSDSRSGEPRMYSQKVNSLGVVQWTANGVLMITDIGDTGTVSGLAFSDGVTGVYLAAWRVLSSGSEPNLSFQHIDSLGAALWGATGVTIASNIEATFLTQSNRRQNFACLSDGTMAFAYGGGTSTSLFVRKLAAANGATVWTTSNLLSGGEDINTQSVALVPTNDGGIITLYVTSANVSSPERVRARLINSSGASVWGPNTLYTGVVSNGARVAAVPDGSNGALFLFSQSSPTVAALAARVLSSGSVQFSGVAAAGEIPTPGTSSGGVYPAPGVNGSMVSVTNVAGTSVTAYRVSADGTVSSSTLISDAVGAGNDNKTMYGLVGSAGSIYTV